ncbi:hypothetical protein OJ996_24055 [Luteolibacter sp. GHJ8]|uniref:Lipoprotein n=1 Tax=Luteolibacter rhizosphaerae TaxID=2989719 RepID=A0ABT3GAL0_9BACT|nr:hypothetical protein [Luteolibacter rhizosphaerae]MCW1916682.1 hypothetical protein [Luteolibacter rhizosphaerae]
MVKPSAILVSALVLTQCSPSNSGNASIALGQYSELATQDRKSPKKYRVTMKFIENNQVTSSPAIIAKRGQEAKIEMLREFVYPDDFKPAETSRLTMEASKQKGIFPVTPTTPKRFATRDLGYTASLSVEPQGGFVVIKGLLSHEKFAGFSRAPGEAISPLVDAGSKVLLTDNRVDLPNFVRSETPLYVAGLPGVEHVVDLPAIPAKVAIICEPVE